MLGLTLLLQRTRRCENADGSDKRGPHSLDFLCFNGRTVIRQLIIDLMAAHFASSYVDRLFSERDLYAIHHLISVREMQRPLPEEFWLFCRIYEWAPARSGVWQHYECLSDEAFMRMSQALERFGLVWIAEKYQLGRNTWNGPDRAADLDRWLDSHAQQIHDAAFSLIEARKDFLKDNS